MLNFIILTHGRCGSNLLWRTLDTHPQLNVFTDVFNRRKWGLVKEEYKINTVKDVFAYCNGCSVHHSDRKYMPNLFHKLRAIDGLKVILLRRNPLTRLVSWKLSQETGHSIHEGYGDHQIYIDPEEAYSNFHEITEMESFSVGYFMVHEMCEVRYENLCANWNDSIKEIQQFLGVKTVELTPAITKQDNLPVCDRVKNYNQLKEYMSDTQWSGLFEESNEYK